MKATIKITYNLCAVILDRIYRELGSHDNSPRTEWGQWKNGVVWDSPSLTYHTCQGDTPFHINVEECMLYIHCSRGQWNSHPVLKAIRQMLYAVVNTEMVEILDFQTSTPEWGLFAYKDPRSLDKKREDFLEHTKEDDIITVPSSLALPEGTVAFGNRFWQAVPWQEQGDSAPEFVPTEMAVAGVEEE